MKSLWSHYPTPVVDAVADRGQGHHVLAAALEAGRELEKQATYWKEQAEKYNNWYQQEASRAKDWWGD